MTVNDTWKTLGRRPQGTPGAGAWTGREHPESPLALTVERDAPSRCDSCHKPLSEDPRSVHSCSVGLEVDLLDPADDTHRAAAATEIADAHAAGITDPDAVRARLVDHFAAAGVVATPETLEGDHEWGPLIRDAWPAAEPDRRPLDDLIGAADQITWKGAGFRPSEMAAWTAAGVNTPTVARRCLDAGITVDQARRPALQDNSGYPRTRGELLELGTMTIDEARAAPAVPDAQGDIGF